MEKILGIILGLTSAFIGSVGFYGYINQVNDDTIGSFTMGVFSWILALLIVWLGFNVKKLEIKTLQKTKERLNAIKGFKNNEINLNGVNIKVFHNVSYSILGGENNLLIGFELNDYFTDYEKDNLKKSFSHKQIENKEYLVFDYTPFLFLNQIVFQKRLNDLLNKVLEEKRK